MKRRTVILFFLIQFMIISCTYIPEDQDGVELLGKGLWRVYVDTPGFGKYVAIDGNIALIGAPNDSISSAHIFEYIDTNWVCTASYFSEDSLNYGYAKNIAVSNDIIAISDYVNNKIYTYKKEFDEWVMLNVIKSPDVNEFNEFGRSIDLYENYLVIGSTGPAIVFKNTGNDWVELTRLPTKSNPELESSYKVSISEDYICVANDSVYTFERSGESFINVTKVDSFRMSGNSINIHGNTLVVGGVMVELDIDGVYIFQYIDSKWEKIQEIAGSFRNYFGPSVGLHSGYLAFGDDPHHFLFSPNNYNFYLYSEHTVNPWTFIKQLNYYGSLDIALSNEYAIIGGSGCARIYRYR